MSLDRVWHYTDGRGFEGIVTHDVLRATSFRHLNDSQEAEYATTVLQDAADALRERLPESSLARFDDLMGFAQRRNLDLFLLCAAQEPDLLTVWRGYGGQVSYAVELDANVPLLPVQRVRGKRHPNPPKDHVVEWDEDGEGRAFISNDPDRVHIEQVKWAPVQYDTVGIVDERVQRVADIAGRDSDPFNDVFLPWLNLADIELLALKNPAFLDEREARMILEVRPRWKFVHHRDGRYGTTPFIELSAENEENRTHAHDGFLQRPGTLPIKSVMIGPTPLGDEVLSATEEFLEFNGYPDVTVKRSKIPFRS